MEGEEERKGEGEQNRKKTGRRVLLQARVPVSRSCARSLGSANKSPTDGSGDDGDDGGVATRSARFF